jgi:hypothetical protein
MDFEHFRQLALMVSSGSARPGSIDIRPGRWSLNVVAELIMAFISAGRGAAPDAPPH